MDVPLQSGVYQVQVQCTPASINLGAITIQAGQTTDLGRIDLSSGDGVIVGHVTRNGGMPLNGDDMPSVRVERMDEAESGLHYSCAPKLERDEFRVESLEAGRYRVEVHLGGEDIEHLARRFVDVLGGKESRVEVDFLFGDGIIEGVVQPQAMHNTAVLVLVHGNVDVGSAFQTGLASFEGQSLRARCDETGAFMLDALAPAVYDIFAVSVGPEGGAYGVQTVTLPPAGRVTVTLAATTPLPR